MGAIYKIKCKKCNNEILIYGLDDEPEKKETYLCEKCGYLDNYTIKDWKEEVSDTSYELKCKNCGGIRMVWNEENSKEKICEKCGKLDYYSEGKESVCKFCGAEKLVYPDLKRIECGHCGKVGEFENKKIPSKIFSLRCKKCGSKRLNYPETSQITCPKCKKKGEFEEVKNFLIET